jgi:phosphoribosylaminoimidazolecarboxamide formyltransferase/IMP cyclohydrolase
MTQIAVGRALISVSDKRGLTPFGESLVSLGVEIVSSGGTAAHFEQAGIPVTHVQDVTGAPEMFDGRVKTLHPRIHGGILADLGKESHRQGLLDFGIEPFQLIVSNLYPFADTVRSGADDDTIIENIDIGGPTLIRAAAKNHAWVAVVVSPGRYDEIVNAVARGGTTAHLRRDLAREAFFVIARYDAAIVNWFERDGAQRLVLPLEMNTALRYGENPGQPASLYSTGEIEGWWARGEQIQGKEMSFNNYADADAAWSLVSELPDGSAVVVKHMNACGAATGASMHEAFTKAWAGDPLAAFGGVVALAGELDGDTARAITENFVEIVIATSITDEAKALMAQKKNLRVFTASYPSDDDLDIRSIDGGFLVQKSDTVVSDASGWESRSREPSAVEITDLEIAWTIAAHAKSNAIVLVKDGAAVGVGTGDQSRIGAAERALAKAAERAHGSVCASDAFFPFRDGPDALAAAGITAIVEPGGSMRDQEVIESAQEHAMALLFTGERHFRH